MSRQTRQSGELPFVDDQAVLILQLLESYEPGLFQPLSPTTVDDGDDHEHDVENESTMDEAANLEEFLGPELEGLLDPELAGDVKMEAIDLAAKLGVVGVDVAALVGAEVPDADMVAALEATLDTEVERALYVMDVTRAVLYVAAAQGEDLARLWDRELEDKVIDVLEAAQFIMRLAELAARLEAVLDRDLNTTARMRRAKREAMWRLFSLRDLGVCLHEFLDLDS